VEEEHGEGIRDYQKLVKTQLVILVQRVGLTVPVPAVIVIPDTFKQKSDAVIIVTRIVQHLHGSVTMALVAVSCQLLHL
jgi:hypothetical protein